MNAPPAVLLDGRYRVGPQLARGGMSTVFSGTDTRLDRPVAIKVMDPRMAGDPAFRARFEREARSAARIDHPAVVGVHDQGEHAGGVAELGLGADGPLLFLVMELVEGGTLRDVLRTQGLMFAPASSAQGAVGVPAALAVMDPMLSGLSEAHRLGLVHRDVKPENVLISRTGEVKVADFGLVTAAAQAGASTAGMIMGTVQYLSPEQVATGDADARSDVYAAGIVLYELLAGAPPYTGDTAISVAYRHVNSDVPPPSAVAPDVPPELDELVLRATRRDPAQRPADAGALLAELRQVAARLAVPRVPPPVPPARPEDLTLVAATPVAGPQRLPPMQAPPPPSPQAGPTGTRAMLRPPVDMVHPGQAPPRRRRLVPWVAVGLVVAVLLGAGLWWFGSGRWTPIPQLAGVAEADAQQQLTAAGFEVKVVEAAHDDVDEGSVIGTDPAEGTSALLGSVVTVTVSSGRPRVPTIPPGTTAESAEQTIRAAGLTPKRRTDDAGNQDDDDDDDDENRGDNDEVPVGTVLRTEPNAGAPVRSGSEVTIVLRGDDGNDAGDDDKVEIPSLVGKRFDEAEEILEDLGLKAEEDSQFLGRDNGIVIGQDPGPFSEVERGGTVRLKTL